MKDPIGPKKIHRIPGEKDADSEANDFYSMSDATWSGVDSESGSEFESSEDSGSDKGSSGRQASQATRKLNNRAQRADNSKSKESQELRWDYSLGDQLVGVEKSSEKQPKNMAAALVPPTLESILQCVVAHREEARMDSKRAQNVARKMQGAVRKIGRTCSNICDWMSEVETRTATLEEDIAGSKGVVEAHEAQLVDIQWKLEESENRQRRNNL